MKKMEYIIVFDPQQVNASLMEDDHGFTETYASYDSAKADGEAWKRLGDCKSYAIYAKCSDERNHIV